MFSDGPASPMAERGSTAHEEQQNQDHLDILNRSIVCKYDTRLIPIVFLAYTVFWLDRANIALARVSGLEQDLRLQNAQFNTSLAVFFATYIVFNIPANLMLRRLGGGLFLPALIVTWGIATLCSGFVHNFTGLCVSRVFVGLAESGFLGGVLLWLGFFYTNEEIVARVGILLSSSPLAASLGGLLAGGLSRIESASYSRWPWIFFIEGAMTVVIGVAAYFIMPNTPDSAPFLTLEEKKAAKDRMVLLDQLLFARRILSLQNDSSDMDPSAEPNLIQHKASSTPSTTVATESTSNDRLHRSIWRRAIVHPVTLFMTLGCFLTVQSTYAFNLFLPTLLTEMGFQSLQNSLMTVPPNVLAFVWTIFVTQYSQRTNRVAFPLLFSAGLATLGFTLLLIGSYAGGTGSSGEPRIVMPLQYAGTFLVGAGVNSTSPLALSWVCINANPHYLRAIVLGFMIGIGNLASVIASFVYIKTNAPKFVY